jgi:mitochondrial GTPase 1
MFQLSCIVIHWDSYEQMDSWLGNRKRILVLNREDMISTADRNVWATHYARQGIKVVFSNGQLGMVLESEFFVQLVSIQCISTRGFTIFFKLQGTMKLGRLAKELAGGVNVKRRAKGLLPRPVSF